MVNSFNLNRKDFYNIELESIWTPTRERDFYLQILGDTEENRKLPLTFLSMKYLEEIISVPRSSYNVMWSFSDYKNTSPFLSQFPDAVVAYSLQKLSKEPTNVIRARRSSDNAEQDFTANEVKGTELLNFVVPTDIQALYGERMYFDGANNYVEVTGMDDTIDYFGACRIKASFVVTNPSATAIVHTLWRSAYRLYTSNGKWVLNSNTNTGVDVTEGLHTTEVVFTSNGDAVEFILNGVSVWTGIAEAGNIGGTSFYIGARDQNGLGLFFQGSIFNVSVENSDVKNFSLLGTGNTNADWTDQVGSNNGIVNGNPARYNLETGAISRDAVQTTAANQPSIVQGGVLNVTDKGKPSLFLNQQNLVYQQPLPISFETGVRINTIFQNSSEQTSGNYIWIFTDGQQATNNRCILFRGSSSSNLQLYLTSKDGGEEIVNILNVDNYADESLLLSIYVDNSGYSYQINNGEIISGVFNNDIDATFFGIGGHSNQSGGQPRARNLHLPELTIFSGDTDINVGALNKNIIKRFDLF